MAAFFIAQVKLKDGKKFQAYAAQTKAIFADFGAELITRGKVMGSIAGDVTHDAVADMNTPTCRNWKPHLPPMLTRRSFLCETKQLM